ncbi:TrgA family protein [Thioclava sp.]|uniref:TrgA family protein n=1 Tax=Thioclava sp. TaxID=1933450 RepID=UPI003242DF29
MMHRIAVRNSQAQIPTIAKLFAALALGATGFFAAQQIMPAIPAGTDGAKELWLIMGSFGLLFGWRVVGVSAGRRWVDAINDGLRGGLYVLLWTFAFLGVMQILKLALRMRYDDVLSAVTDVIGQGTAIGLASLGVMPVITLGLGAMGAGLLSELAHRRYGR